MAAVVPTRAELGALAPELTGRELEALDKRLTALSKVLRDEPIQAKYKVELAFGKARSNRSPTPGMLSFWENGSKLHGGGDAKLYLCPGRRLGKNDCESIMPDSANSEGTIVCSACGTVWPGDQVIGELLFNLPMRKWADVLTRFYYKLGQSVDFYLKYAPDDIRSVALNQAKKQTWRGTQALDRSRATRGKLIYRLSRLITDTANGATPESRLYMFLTA